jgi:hypothetical protein
MTTKIRFWPAAAAIALLPLTPFAHAQGPEACCFTDGSCQDLDPAQCDTLGGIPQGPGTDCATTGCDREACCFPDGSCADLDPATCKAQGGTPQGPNTDCSITTCPVQDEACCFPDGSCADLDPTTCTAQGGTPQGPNTNCSITTCPVQDEACCFPDGTCQNLPPADCSAQGGNPQGAGTDCATFQCPQPTEACCFADGTCADLTPADCSAHGGNPQGAGSNCANTSCPTSPPQACCFSDGTCLDLLSPKCLSNGGTPQGAGTTCATVDCQSPPLEACCLPDGTCAEIPIADCQALGGIAQGAGSSCANADCIPPPEEKFLIEFSVDIGSDAELSDPFVTGNEAFDPGDVYAWRSAPVVPPGRDGFKDDAFIFGVDPAPDPPDGAVPPATAAPVGIGSISYYFDVFDLDGHDQLPDSLQQIVPPTAPLPEPYPLPTASPCVPAPRVLLISMDDDRAAGWPAPPSPFAVPVDTPSPAGILYGGSATRDEVQGILPFGGPGPAPIVPVLYPYVPEDEVHSSLAPNPPTDREDDDVDSLDVVPSYADCPVWLFSSDHEGTLGLDPSDIYEVTGGGVVPVVDEVIHLGLPDETDINAFEFIAYTPAGAGPVLALLFSVDDDDPLTPGVNESGGLLPSMIYISFLTGSYGRYLTAPLGDDVDAITAWEDVIRACNDPPQDADGDGDVDLSDYGDFLSCYNGPAKPYNAGGDPTACVCFDNDNDGDVDLSDYGDFLTCYNGPGNPPGC